MELFDFAITSNDLIFILSCIYVKNLPNYEIGIEINPIYINLNNKEVVETFICSNFRLLPYTHT
jgi:hypothetical protein